MKVKAQCLRVHFLKSKKVSHLKIEIKQNKKLEQTKNFWIGRDVMKYLSLNNRGNKNNT